MRYNTPRSMMVEPPSAETVPPTVADVAAITDVIVAPIVGTASGVVLKVPAVVTAVPSTLVAFSR